MSQGRLRQFDDVAGFVNSRMNFAKRGGRPLALLNARNDAMPLTESDIQPGKCYATRGAERYRVLGVNRGIVTYQSWTVGRKISPLRINAGVKAFAEAVRKEIICPAES